MTLHAILLPKWGLTMEEGALASWLAETGTIIGEGEEIAEIETSKIAGVLESPAAGVLRRQLAAPGEVKPVGALLGVVADAAEDEIAIDAFVADFAIRPSAARATAGTPQATAITVNGHTTCFLKAAAASGEPLRAPLLLIHGYGGNHLNWMLNQEALARDRDVYALDLPGHGGSSKNVADGTLEALAARIGEWLAALKIDSVHLVGHSLGAAAAATLALSSPKRVRSLTALCGAGFGAALNRTYLEGFLAAGRRKDLKPVMDLLFENKRLATRAMLDELIAYKRTDGVADALRWLLDGALSEESLLGLRSRLRNVEAPMLAIFGEKDQIAPVGSTDGMPGQVRTIAAAGHMLQLEAPAAVNDEIAAFTRRHD
jgi:pyruvate dehydrogenase E2 component (dihydrolipoamide acetyltransferase)